MYQRSKRGSRGGKSVKAKHGSADWSAEEWRQWYGIDEEAWAAEQEERKLRQEAREIERARQEEPAEPERGRHSRSRTPSRAGSLSTAEALRLQTLEEEERQLKELLKVQNSSSSSALAAASSSIAEGEVDSEQDTPPAYASVPFAKAPFPTRDPQVESLSSSHDSNQKSEHSRAESKSEELTQAPHFAVEEVDFGGEEPSSSSTDKRPIVAAESSVRQAAAKGNLFNLQDPAHSKAKPYEAYWKGKKQITPVAKAAHLEARRSSLQESKEDYRVAEGRVFGEYQPREFELRRAAQLVPREPSVPPPARLVELSTTATKAIVPEPYWRKEKWQTDESRWPVRENRGICLDFHGVLQIKKNGRWLVPAQNVEICQRLIDLGWNPVIISWVGSRKREASTREEIRNSGLEAVVGREGRGFHIFCYGERADKVRRGKEFGLTVYVDDSEEVIAEADNTQGCYGIPINGGSTFPDGYYDLAQALSVERILFRAPAFEQDR